MSDSWSTSCQPDYVCALGRRKIARNRQGEILYTELLKSWSALGQFIAYSPLLRLSGALTSFGSMLSSVVCGSYYAKRSTLRIPQCRAVGAAIAANLLSCAIPCDLVPVITLRKRPQRNSYD